MVIIKSLKVTNRLGIHARVAAKLVHAASQFKSSIVLEFNGQQVNAKSILGILTLACPVGNHISVQADGPDADAAMIAFEQLFTDKFGED